MAPPARLAARFARAHGLPEAAREALEALLREVVDTALEGVVPASQLDISGESSPDRETWAGPRESNMVRPAAPARSPTERYEHLLPLGTGGMGEVWRVRDHTLGRTVAMKILKPELAQTTEAIARFESEVRLTARLQHPGILPIYDVGRLQDGRAFYTMREALGDTLAATLRRLSGARDGPGTQAELRSLVGALRRVCAAVAYAHEAGVTHGDLKPANLMLGPFGDVIVLDWGLARTRGAAAVPAEHAPKSTARTAGTPGYLAPELVRGEGDGTDPRGDVYALGATLWEVLTGRRIRSAEAAGRLLEEGAPLPDLPAGGEALARVALAALAPAPEDRTSTASEMGGSLDDWLEGVIERERASALVEHARQRLPQMQTLRREAERLVIEAAQRRDQIPTWAPVTDKYPYWTIEDTANEHARDATMLEVAYVEELRAALFRAPDLPDARELLADHYQRLHAGADRRRDRISAEAYEQLLRRHDRGRHAAWLAGTGWLTLRSAPEAQARLYRFELQDRRLVAVEEGHLGSTPLERHPLPHGSYLVELSAPGHHTVRYPVRIDRGAHWDGIAPPLPGEVPGGPAPLAAPVALPPAGSLDEDDVFVPGGWFRSGDPEARNGLPIRDVWVDAFVIRRHPVTNAGFVRFLNALLAEGREPAALEHVPRGSDRSRDPAGVAIFARDAAGNFFVGADPEGDILDPDWPVVLVSWDGARAYAAWEAERTGLAWRLPWELEREKAVRGVDGRLYPWGDHPEPTWSHNGQAQRGRALPARVQDTTNDVSPYGVYGGAGNVRDRCLDRARAVGPTLTDAGRFTPPPPHALDPEAPLLDRGGAWSAGIAYGRVGQRLWSPPGFRNSLIGFRLARDG